VLYASRTLPCSEVSEKWPSTCPPGRAGARPRGLRPCSRAGACSSEEAVHRHSGRNRSLPVGWRCCVLYGDVLLLASRSARGDKAPARGEGQALARAAFGLVRGRWRAVPRKRCIDTPGATVACPWDGAATGERVCFMVTCSSPLRGQREVTKRQPAGTGRRSPARPLALFAGGCGAAWHLTHATLPAPPYPDAHPRKLTHG